jgi:phosphoribosylanthranilate isomerase
VKVKICGITNQSDAAMCEDMGADAVGFVHFPGRTRSIPVERISEICSTVGPMTAKVMVCAPADQDRAIELAVNSGVDALQLYTMNPAQLEEIRGIGVKVMRVIKPDRLLALEFADSTDALVFENGEPGTGSSYNYSSVPIDSCPRAIIAGGLNLANLASVKALHPYAVDVSSGVERSPGKKDPQMVSEFVRMCRE